MRALFPVERILAGWLLVGTALLLILGRDVERFALHLVAHLLPLLGLLLLARLPDSTRGRAGRLRRLLPLAIAPLLYGEVSVLNQLIHGGATYDPTVVGWERALFGHDLAVELRVWWPWRPLGELLAFAYFSYYFLGLLFWIGLALRRRWDAMDESLTAIGLVFVGCQLWFVLFPVQGPFHYFPPPDPETLGWFFPSLVHRVLHAGSSVGTAFPSSHCAVAGILLLMAWRHERRSAAILSVLVPLLTLGAVHGGFHYGVDAVAGWLWCLLLMPLGIRLHRRWSRS